MFSVLWVLTDDSILVRLDWALLALRSGGRGVRTWVQPGFELFFSFIGVQTWVQPGFELLEEFELFQGSENSILNLGSTWVLIGFHSTWVEPGLNLG